MTSSSSQAMAVRIKAIRPLAPRKSSRRPRRIASSTDPARYSRDISVVGQPNANTGKVMYPSRPSGRTPLAALSNSAAARSSGQRLGTGALLQLAARDFPRATARHFVEDRDLPWHFVIRQILPDMLLEYIRSSRRAGIQNHKSCKTLTELLIVDAYHGCLRNIGVRRQS